jgi:ubiquinone/menaquinone biosynthesis C-methylase UbiE
MWRKAMSSKPYFDQVAGRWDQLRAGFFSDAVRDKALALAGLEPGKTAVDLGAGTGFITQGLVRQGLRVIAVDESEAMLREMRKKFAAVEGIDYRVREAHSLPLGDGSADYVFANMYLHHVEDPPAAIGEMVRILRPAGRVVITDLDQHPFEFLRREHHDRWLGFNREEVRTWLEDAGLEQVSVDCVGEECCARSADGSDSAKISIFLATGVK